MMSALLPCRGCRIFCVNGIIHNLFYTLENPEEIEGRRSPGQTVSVGEERVMKEIILLFPCRAFLEILKDLPFLQNFIDFVLQIICEFKTEGSFIFN